jgi:hypothetical protein
MSKKRMYWLIGEKDLIERVLPGVQLGERRKDAYYMDVALAPEDLAKLDSYFGVIVWGPQFVPEREGNNGL